MGEIPLMTDHRLVRHQRHRARHRLAAAPLAGRVLRARPRQDAFVRQAAVLGAHDSVSRLVARLRVRPEGHLYLPRRPPPQDAGHDPAEGARLHARADPRRVLRVRHVPPARRPASSSSSCPSACAAKSRASTSRPRPARSSSRRTSASRSSTCATCGSAGSTKISVPEDFLLGRALAQNVVDKETGEIVANANDEITEDAAAEAARGGRRQDPDDLHQRPRPGPVHLADAAHRRNRRPDGGAGRDLPHDASRRAADRRRGRRRCSTACSSPRSATTCRRSAA